MKYDDMFQMVGGTPHVRVQTPAIGGARVHIKLEGWNPTGSVKDRACLSLIKSRREDGSLQSGKILLDASSGNMACAVAYFGKLLGHKTTVVVNSKLTEDKRNFLRYFGATLHQVGDFTIQGNQFCREMVGRPGGEQYCFLDQLHNWANPKAYYESMGPEILNDFPDVAMIVGSLGSGGSMLGTGQFFNEHRPGVKVVVVQAASGTRIPGTGAFDDGDYVTPFIEKGFATRIFNHAVNITEQNAIQGTVRLRAQGIFCGIQAGGVLHAALHAIKTFEVEGDVVIIAGDSGWKNMDKLLRIEADEARQGGES
jgi:cysteine synthase